MGVASVLVQAPPLVPNPPRPGLLSTKWSKLSLRQNTKHLAPPQSLLSTLSPLSPATRLPSPARSSSSAAAASVAAAEYDDRTTPISKARSLLSSLTPLRLLKWSAIAFLAVAASKATARAALSPFFWMYFSWSWIFWPWMLAAAAAAYGLRCLSKHGRGEASPAEQLAVVAAAVLWLTLVPPAHFNGFLEGWPLVFFFAYLYFFFFHSTVRKRMYGDLYPRPHDAKWDVATPSWTRALFCSAVLAGHWFAAAEGPELHLIGNGWASAGIWGLILVALFMQYHACWYLAKYSEKVVVPSVVVKFGPFRWVRHPMYASTMLMFAAYAAALRAPLSCLFLVAVCVAYYEQKARLEEELLLETFGVDYREYMSKVKYKLIPLVY